jgi:hypothetical protein
MVSIYVLSFLGHNFFYYLILCCLGFEVDNLFLFTFYYGLEKKILHWVSTRFYEKQSWHWGDQNWNKEKMGAFFLYIYKRHYGVYAFLVNFPIRYFKIFLLLVWWLNVLIQKLHFIYISVFEFEREEKLLENNIRENSTSMIILYILLLIWHLIWKIISLCCFNSFSLTWTLNA